VARYASFGEFWPHYVREHGLPLTRRLHFIGTSLVIGVFLLALFTHHFAVLWLMPLAGYGFAWVSHFFVEKNRPATFTYPFYSLAADFVMYAKMWRGQMDDEVRRANAQ
jgi:hypothetical protein